MWDYMTLEPTNDQRTVIWGVTENGEEKKAIQIRSYNVDGEWKLQYQNGSAWVDIGTLDAGKWYHFKVIEDYSSSKRKQADCHCPGRRERKMPPDCASAVRRWLPSDGDHLQPEESRFL